MSNAISCLFGSAWASHYGWTHSCELCAGTENEVLTPDPSKCESLGLGLLADTEVLKVARKPITIGDITVTVIAPKQWIIVKVNDKEFKYKKYKTFKESLKHIDVTQHETKILLSDTKHHWFGPKKSKKPKCSCPCCK